MEESLCSLELGFSEAKADDETTCSKSRGSCGLLEEGVEASQLLTSQPILVVPPPPPVMHATLSIEDFEFVMGGDFNSDTTGDLCLEAVFGVVGEVDDDDVNNPLPADR